MLFRSLDTLYPVLDTTKPTLAQIRAAFVPRIPRFDQYKHDQERLGLTASFQFAPSDGRAWTNACTAVVDIRMVRGGAWRDASHATRAAARWSASSRYYDNRIGFRIARRE